MRRLGTKYLNAKKWGTSPIRIDTPFVFILVQYRSVLHNLTHLLRLDTCQCDFQDLSLDSAHSQALLPLNFILFLNDCTQSKKVLKNSKLVVLF